MEQIIWVRKVFRDWPRSAAGDSAFATVARSFEAAALLPDRQALKAAQPVDDADRAGLAAWHGWTLYVDGDRPRGLRQLKAAAAAGSPETLTLLGAALLLDGQRGGALKVLSRAARRGGAGALAGQLITQMGERRDPVLGFLARSNPLNRWLGRLRHRRGQERAGS